MLNYIENIILIFIILSSFFVIIVANPVQSLLWLIMTFGLSSIIFMILGIEFLSLLIFMIYIGAIAVLFLFVVMMLNIKIVELKSLYLNYIPVSIFVLLIFFFELIISVFSFLKYTFIYEYTYINWLSIFDYKGNIYLFGYLIYTYFGFILILIGLLLFISMIGSIILVINWDIKYNSVKKYSEKFLLEKRKIKFFKNK